ncbi:MAG TPA: carboxypeptidase regulatory-like domain-containing protein [Rubricoccaceae bacterium]
MRALPLRALLLVPILTAAIASPRPAAVLSGTVTDAATGEPIHAANVTVIGTALGAATDAQGRFEITDGPVGTVDVRVTAVGFAGRVERGVVLRDGTPARLDVRLTAAEIEVVVADRGAARGTEMHMPGTPRRTAPGAPPPVAAPMGREIGATSAEAGGDAVMRSRSEADTDDGERAAPRPRRTPPRSQTRAGVLTAGDIDDGLNWDRFLSYSERAVQRGSSLRDLRLDDRLTLRILDLDGRPIAGARVRIDAEGGRGAGLTTEAGTDGRLALFPRYDFGVGTERLEISVTAPGGRGTARTETVDVRRLRGDAQRTIRLRTRAERPQALDLAVVLDVTGSMGDEHRYLTDEFENIIAQARRRYPDADLRFALVAYRDHGDDFVVRRWDFTRSEREMRSRLAQLSAGGGGDMPEAMDEALDALLELDWRTGTAARIAFVVADAPPHANRLSETLAAVREARARGLRLYPLAASGVDATAEHILRTAAVLTQGRYLWLTDDSGVGNAHGEPRVPCYDVQTVDQLVARVIESELAGRRIEADPQDIVRTVGNPVSGVCASEAVSQQSTPRRSTGGLGYD